MLRYTFPYTLFPPWNTPHCYPTRFLGLLVIHYTFATFTIPTLPFIRHLHILPTTVPSSTRLHCWLWLVVIDRWFGALFGGDDCYVDQAVIDRLMTGDYGVDGDRGLQYWPDVTDLTTVVTWHCVLVMMITVQFVVVDTGPGIILRWWPDDLFIWSIYSIYIVVVLRIVDWSTFVWLFIWLFDLILTTCYSFWWSPDDCYPGDGGTWVARQFQWLMTFVVLMLLCDDYSDHSVTDSIVDIPGDCYSIRWHSVCWSIDGSDWPTFPTTLFSVDCWWRYIVILSVTIYVTAWRYHTTHILHTPYIWYRNTVPCCWVIVDGDDIGDVYSTIPICCYYRAYWRKRPERWTMIDWHSLVMWRWSRWRWRWYSGRWQAMMMTLQHVVPLCYWRVAPVFFDTIATPPPTHYLLHFDWYPDLLLWPDYCWRVVLYSPVFNWPVLTVGPRSLTRYTRRYALRCRTTPHAHSHHAFSTRALRLPHGWLIPGPVDLHTVTVPTSLPVVIVALTTTPPTPPLPVQLPYRSPVTCYPHRWFPVGVDLVVLLMTTLLVLPRWCSDGGDYLLLMIDDADWWWRCCPMTWRRPPTVTCRGRRPIWRVVLVVKADGVILIPTPDHGPSLFIPHWRVHSHVTLHCCCWMSHRLLTYDSRCYALRFDYLLPVDVWRFPTLLSYLHYIPRCHTVHIPYTYRLPFDSVLTLRFTHYGIVDRYSISTTHSGPVRICDPTYDDYVDRWHRWWRTITVLILLLIWFVPVTLLLIVVVEHCTVPLLPVITVLLLPVTIPSCCWLLLLCWCSFTVMVFTFPFGGGVGPVGPSWWWLLFHVFPDATVGVLRLIPFRSVTAIRCLFRWCWYTHTLPPSHATHTPHHRCPRSHHTTTHYTRLPHTTHLPHIHLPRTYLHISYGYTTFTSSHYLPLRHTPRLRTPLYHTLCLRIHTCGWLPHALHTVYSYLRSAAHTHALHHYALHVTHTDVYHTVACLYAPPGSGYWMDVWVRWWSVYHRPALPVTITVWSPHVYHTTAHLRHTTARLPALHHLISRLTLHTVLLFYRTPARTTVSHWLPTRIHWLPRYGLPDVGFLVTTVVTLHGFYVPTVVRSLPHLLQSFFVTVVRFTIYRRWVRWLRSTLLPFRCDLILHDSRYCSGYAFTRYVPLIWRLIPVARTDVVTYTHTLRPHIPPHHTTYPTAYTTRCVATTTPPTPAATFPAPFCPRWISPIYGGDLGYTFPDYYHSVGVIVTVRWFTTPTHTCHPTHLHSPHTRFRWDDTDFPTPHTYLHTCYSTHSPTAHTPDPTWWCHPTLKEAAWLHSVFTFGAYDSPLRSGTWLTPRDYRLILHVDGAVVTVLKITLLLMALTLLLLHLRTSIHSTLVLFVVVIYSVVIVVGVVRYRRCWFIPLHVLTLPFTSGIDRYYYYYWWWPGDSPNLWWPCQWRRCQYCIIETEECYVDLTNCYWWRQYWPIIVDGIRSGIDDITDDEHCWYWVDSCSDRLIHWRIPHLIVIGDWWLHSFCYWLNPTGDCYSFIRWPHCWYSLIVLRRWLLTDMVTVTIPLSHCRPAANYSTPPPVDPFTPRFPFILTLIRCSTTQLFCYGARHSLLICYSLWQLLFTGIQTLLLFCPYLLLHLLITFHTTTHSTGRCYGSGRYGRWWPSDPIDSLTFRVFGVVGGWSHGVPVLIGWTLRLPAPTFGTFTVTVVVDCCYRVSSRLLRSHCLLSRDIVAIRWSYLPCSTRFIVVTLWRILMWWRYSTLTSLYLIHLLHSPHTHLTHCCSLLIYSLLLHCHCYWR